MDSIWLIWVIFAALVGAAASVRGRSGLGWAIIAVAVSPLLAVILLALLPKVRDAGAEAPTPETHVRCPDCRELVRMDARVCKHCGCRLVPSV